MMFGAPTLYMCMGMWLFSNQQVFKNKVSVNKTIYYYDDADHKLMQFFKQITPGTVFFIFCFITVIYHLTRYVIRKLGYVDTEL